jgi:CBS domain-containing protein
MRVEDVMTRAVVSVSPDTTVEEAARLMAERRISGVPVVDTGGRLVGMLTEGDLILRQRPREAGPWWRHFFRDPERLAQEYQKAVGATAREVMTTTIISVRPSLPIGEAAAILDRQRIRRLPVVDERGHVVGIVSRGDLVRALAAAPTAAGPEVADADLAREMQNRLAQEPWVSNLGIVVQAQDGVLVLWGMVATDAEKSAIETMARAIRGTRRVESHLVVVSGIPAHFGV